MKFRSPTIIVLFFFLLESVFSHALEPKTSSIRFSGVPALGFGPDSGFGGGVIGNMYVDEEGFYPYKMLIGIKAYLTTKGINSHALQFDRVNAFALPLRLQGRLGFFSNVAQNYCGRASDATCEESLRPPNNKHFYLLHVGFYGRNRQNWN
jgi:hypothetical protein